MGEIFPPFRCHTYRNVFEQFHFDQKARCQTYTIRGYHKIKHFACHRDLFVLQLPRIKHTQNASNPGIKHFKWLIQFSTNDWLWNVLYPGMKHFAYVLYVGFHAKRNLCDKQNVLFYGTPRIKKEGPPYWFHIQMEPYTGCTIK